MNELELTPEDQALIDDELALHERVKYAVRDKAMEEPPDMTAIQERLKELRDEAITASERDLPALFQQLYTHHSLASRTYEEKLPDMRAPYFAHMRLIEKGKARDILVGYQTFIDSAAPGGGITIIDWRNAVLAKVFFNFREGDEFEMELPGRLAQGTVLQRRVIAFEVGEMVGITCPDRAYVRTRGGTWRKVEDVGTPSLAGGAGKAVNINQFGAALSGGKRLPDVSALLDREQYEILNREDQGALLILGGAGSGKTTIALHRLAMLSYQRPRFYQPSAMKVVVPEHGLVRLTQRLLSGLSVGNVGVETFDAWITDQGKHMLKGIPKRLYDWTPPAVIQIKRHPAMMAAVDAYVELLAKNVAERLRFVASGIEPSFDPAADFLADVDTPLMTRLDEHERKVLARLEELFPEKTQLDWRRTTFATVWREGREAALDINTGRSDLYTRPEMVRILIEQSGGMITERKTKELERHTRKQFEEVNKLDMYDDDEEDGNRREVDGSEVQLDEYAGTIDVEDYGVLLYFMLRVHGRLQRKTKSVSQYKHLVIDEAQDLAPMEHRLLGCSVGGDATVTIAGDAVQQSDPTIAFRGWDDVLEQLGVEAVEEARLTTNYRCSRQVAELGHKVLGPMAPPELPHSVKEGMPVMFSTFPNEGLAVVAITEALSALFERERLASVAIICEREENAKRIYDSLNNLDDVRLVTDGEFEFKPGIDVTDVSQIKGLEFDYVIIPDANLNDYPDTPVARRTLHIAVTRAVHQLWCISVGRPTEII